MKQRVGCVAPAEWLLRAIDGFDGQATTRAALRLAPLVFVRPGELRCAEWKEFDFDEAEWIIPAEKMKMRRPHRVPLSGQALIVLKDLKAITGELRWLFPSVSSVTRPIGAGSGKAWSWDPRRPGPRPGQGPACFCTLERRSTALEFC